MYYSLKTGFTLTLLLMLCSCSKKEDYSAYFGGQVANPHVRYVLFSKGNKVIDTLPLDKNNRFFIKFDSLTPGLYSFKHEPEYQYVYFDRNDSLMVTINTDDFDRSIVFTGRGERKNNFMMELFMAHDADREKSYGIYNYDPEKFIKTIDSSYALRKAFYEKNKKDIQWSNGFDAYAKLRLMLNYFSKKEYYPYIHGRRSGIDVTEKLPKDFYSFRRDINLNDDNLVGYSPYLRYLTAMINNMAITRYYKDGMAEESSFRDNISKLDIADSVFKNKAVKNEVLNALAFNYLLEDQNMANNQKFLDRYMQLSSDKNADNEIRKIGEAIKNLKPGSDLPSIPLVDSTGKTFNLKDIKEETVLFFWTSCARAHTEHAYEKISELKQKYPNVDFIAINVDSDAEWKSTLTKYKTENVLELRSTNFDELREKWVITKIKRTIILNSNGSIKNAFTNLLDDDFEKSL
ncbi:redoxin family protein [Flavobacterium sp. Sd200]|uniref:TlpA family protein disulfide reductase n=1 Tax=Flavobacterium sp. Sd200 TaxID=2692211 RepID=UPI00136FD26B|nr:thioredoxin-like domain-containing protein [Flavobacterium sp. Sd200]MXN90709.1 redoxin family protein [Flavobacterium sp. Sd200]